MRALTFDIAFREGDECLLRGEVKSIDILGICELLVRLAFASGELGAVVSKSKSSEPRGLLTGTSKLARPDELFMTESLFDLFTKEADLLWLAETLPDSSFASGFCTSK